MQAAPTDAFRYEHLFRIDQVVEAQISPDGSRVAVVTERPKPETYYSRQRTIWLVPRAGGKPERVPAADAGSSLDNPVWSPDSRKILYRVARDKVNELVVRDLGSNQSRVLQPCGTKETVGVAIWSPDASRIAAICNGANPLTASVEEKKEEKGGLESKAIVATRSRLYDDSLAKRWSPERRAVVMDLTGKKRVEAFNSQYLLDEPGALQWREAETLWIVGTPANPFGGMAFVSGRTLHRYDVRQRRLDTLAGTVDTERMPLLTGPDAGFIVPVAGTVASPDPSQFRKTWELEPLQLFEFSNGKQGQDPLASLEIYVGRSAPFLWSRAGGDGAGNGTLYFQWFDRGSNRIKAFHADRTGQERWQDLTPAGKNVIAFSLSADGRTMALVTGDANTPNDVYLLDLKQPSTSPSRLTRFGDAVRDLFQVSDVETVRWRSKDDRFDIDGWLLKPADYQPGKRYPLILLVHGGPGVAFRNSFDAMHFEGAHQVPPELYLARGYMVLMANPRGDPGYGRQHQEAILEGWEFPTNYDLIPGVQEMVRRGYADPERLGIAGASYGGWVTAFAVTQTDMFKAASAHDPVIDTGISSAVAYRGNLLGNYWLHAGFVDNHLLDAPFPTSDPRKVNTPILLRFGLKEQPPMPSMFFVSGLEYFTYLHAHCKPVEMIMHPEEGHGIGDGETLRDYVDRDLAWFDYWLLGKGGLPYKPHTCHP
ncbi:S9 family peptidase [Pseudoxanthomonas yeongjuensis]|uniref:S9 family peptidase n=1 Tax=Pseudoxanthomonas yeongjuensis TaxID=377616 RepID=UPI001390BA2A|nr:prolyl oligopeptidase family serine peptidase [Pseudoxanthomonas yeongjuensis]